jgi:3-methylcrotonyl-CoA carboxylase alpha subunit
MADAKILAFDGIELTLLVDGRIVRGAVEKRGNKALVHHRGLVWTFDARGAREQKHAGEAEASELFAPMTGTVVQVFAKDGDAVPKGAALVIVEAMKMEHRITAPGAARVKRVYVKKGDQVDVGALLVSLDPGAG